MGKPAKRGRFPKVAKAPKDHVHVAFCLNYCGTAYRGLQIQGHGPTHHTVEGVCVQAMKDIGLIAAVERGRPGGDQHHFARSCRTDRGVHAIRNLLSIFVHQETFASLGGEIGIRDKMNAALPDALRVAQVTVVAPNFVPRNCCNRRVYRYMVPVYALLPPCDSWEALVARHADFYAALQSWANREPDQQRTVGATPFVDLDDRVEPSHAATAADAPSWVTELRASIRKANQTLRDHFVGPHRFHNFSVDAVEFRGQSKVIKPDTDEAARSVYRCEVASRLFLLPVAAHGGVSLREYETNKAIVAASASSAGASVASSVTPAPSASTRDVLTAAPRPTCLPFVVFQIEGNSFLFNMIRKIVGTLIAVCRGASEGMVATALSPEHRVCTPLAPGSYLYLSLSSYHGYDATIRTLPPSSTLRTLQEAWGGHVAREVEDFAFDAIAKDTVDIDLHRMPPLDELLLSRDKARDVVRPAWREEDAHLASMKEYKPIEEGAARKPPLSEMTHFLRKLRVHNWSVKHVPLPENSKAMLELKNKRARLEEANAVAADTAADAAASGDAGPALTPAVVESQPAAPRQLHTDATTPADPSRAVESRPEAGEDGWIYVAPTEAEENALRQAQFLARWKRARPWEFNEDELEDDASEVGDNDE